MPSAAGPEKETRVYASLGSASKHGAQLELRGVSPHEQCRHAGLIREHVRNLS